MNIKIAIFLLEILNLSNSSKSAGKFDEFLILSELSENATRLCVEFFESDKYRFFEDIQSEAINQLRFENQLKFGKNIEEGDEIYIAFEIQNLTIPSSIQFPVLSNDKYFAKIEISDLNIELSSYVDIKVPSKNIKFESNSLNFYEFNIRFSDGKIYLSNIESGKKILKSEVDLSIKPQYSSNTVKIQNLFIFDIIYHNGCNINGTYYRNLEKYRNFSRETRKFERSVLEGLGILSGRTGVHNISLASKSDWSEEFMFHLLFGNSKENPSFFQIQYKNDEEIAYDYKIENNTLKIGYLEKHWKVYVVSASWESEFLHETPENVSDLDEGLSLVFNDTKSRSYPVQRSVLEGSKDQIIIMEHSHPCKDGYNCKYAKNEIKIKIESNSIFGFRYLDKKDYLINFCFISDFKNRNEKSLPFYKNCKSIDNPLYFDSESKSVIGGIISKKISKKSSKIMEFSNIQVESKEIDMILKKRNEKSESIKDYSVILSVLGSLTVITIIIQIFNFIIMHTFLFSLKGK
ncbi:unnamed protein product [Caenorhabditis angaria]|uniref:Uncharacterized protein n=1 Tax=Caenorhabditis angaria TaxID=860376 RepID=A0A9P1I8F6_9PELO|nr:unnamed protein product [Caenorhabditis angaria]